MNGAFKQNEPDIGERIEDGTFDRLILAIVQKDDERGLTDALNERGIPHTRINTKGGFLRTPNTAFVFLCHHTRRDEVMGVLKRTCRVRMERVNWVVSAGPHGGHVMGDWNDYVDEVQVGGATAFELKIEECQRI